MTSPFSAPSGRWRGKRVMEVRTWAASMGWLDGRLRWRDGQVAWEWHEGLLTPGPADLARARHRLGKIERSPYAADQVFGDGRAWLARHYARLELAQRLVALRAPDLLELSHQRGPEVTKRLAPLLEAEALCLDTLPASPSAALLACRDAALQPLIQLIADSAAHDQARALAALTLGALQVETTPRSERRPRPGTPDAGPPDAEFAMLNRPFLRRAFLWGRRFGLPEHPALIAALLMAQRGQMLAGCMVQALRDGHTFGLPVLQLRELLAQDTPAEQVVALAESAAAIEPLATRLRPPAERPSIEERIKNQRRRDWEAERERSDERRQAQEQQIATLRGLMHAYTCESADPAGFELIAQFVEAMLALDPQVQDGLAVALLALEEGHQELPAALLRDYLDLLVSMHAAFWPPEGRPKSHRDGTLRGWLDHQWIWHARRMLMVLRDSRDAALTRAIVTLKMHLHVADYQWNDHERYRLLLTLQRVFDPDNHAELTGSLVAVLTRFPSVGQARAAFQPLVAALGGLPADQRCPLASTLLDRLDSTEQAPRDVLARLARYATRLTQLVRRTPQPLSDWLLPGLLLIDRLVPGQAMDWVERAVLVMQEIDRQAGRPLSEERPSRLGVQLAAVVADGDLGRFETLLRVFLTHDFDTRPYLLESGFDALLRLPLLRPVIVRMFPQQPQRCVTLLVQVGRAAKLGSAALAPLRELHGAALDGPEGTELCALWLARYGGQVSYPSGWQALFDLAPELLPTAAAYLYARWQLDEPPELPPGVRRALELPRKLAGELAYLERTLATHPERTDLAARVASLRERLADRPRLEAQVRAEASERLAQIAAETHLAAAERQVQLCFRARLAELVGTLPPDLVFDADLLNATMLSVDIRYNRKLLRNLLRAYVSGDHAWREHHPANAAFLERLAQRGVDVNAWLAEYPQTYRCPAVAGARVYLHLERNPIHILQMGNYVNTCLSLGQMNSFSAVANACELNKRVLYALDATGRVVARQLIGINDAGELVGFLVYVAVTNLRQAEELRAVVTRYTTAFAAHCGLTLANSGYVPQLFAEEWYDDGVRPWGEGAAAIQIKP